MNEYEERTTHVELNRRFVEHVGEHKAAAFQEAVQRAASRLVGADHDRAQDVLAEEVRAVGVEMAPPELAALADQIVRFDRVAVHEAGTSLAEQYEDADAGTPRAADTERR